MKLPYADNNRQWLRDGRTINPEWRPAKGTQPGYWELPKAWFTDFVDRALARYGKIYIIQPYRPQEICSSRCRDARGHECECSCMGEHHGSGYHAGWFDVSDTFSTRWGDRELACRLLTARR